MDPNKIISSSKKLNFSTARSAVAPVSSGMAYPVADLIQTFKPEVWEDFTEEWAYSQQKKYAEIVRYAGAGAASVSLMDPNGRKRIVMQVTSDGTPALTFFDENGKVIQQVAPVSLH